jgi:1-aminocyclopropane-1-carboxylate deaminase/D-cysteine desulfhydrase-like pyridoxal-dependent ACC family enzyme
MLSNFERYPLTFGPTPIERLSRLTAHLGDNVEIFAKREDCNSGLAFGGNKLRKLEYIVPDAIASNADTLVSIGGVQSNHTRMVAAVAAKIGMKCHLLQDPSPPPSLSARYRFSQGTFAGTRGNGRDAPYPPFRRSFVATAPEAVPGADGSGRRDRSF